LEVIGIGKDFQNPSNPATKRKNGQMGLHKIKKFLYNNKKKMVSKPKRPPAEWEKIFASYTSDKGLITKMYMNLRN
jgi:hypothetical protein